MKILYHHRTQRRAVEGVHIRGVIKGLEKLGHEIIEVAMVKDKREEEQTRKQDKNELLRLFAQKAPNTLFRLAEIFQNLFSFSSIMTTMKDQHPDIVYERYAYFNFSGMLACKLKGIPMILEVNIVTDLQDTRNLALRSIARFIEKRLLGNADAIFVVSSLLEQALVIRGVDGEKIYVQPNAVDIEEIHDIEPYILPETLNHKFKDKIIIGFLGGLQPWFKLEELIKTFHRINANYPNTLLLMIGDGNLRSPLESMSEEFGIKENTHFFGQVSHEMALRLLKFMDIAVIPSTNMWCSPMKLFEYLGTGIPVVAPNIEAVNSIITDGVHGKLFSYNDFSDFEKALEYLVINEKARKKMGKAGKKHITKNYTWDIVAKKVADEAHSILVRTMFPEGPANRCT